MSVWEVLEAGISAIFIPILCAPPAAPPPELIETVDGLVSLRVLLEAPDPSANMPGIELDLVHVGWEEPKSHSPELEVAAGCEVPR